MAQKFTDTSKSNIAEAAAFLNKKPKRQGSNQYFSESVASGGEYYIEKGSKGENVTESSKVFHKSDSGKTRHIGSVVSTKDGDHFVYPEDHIANVPIPKIKSHVDGVQHLIATDMKHSK